MADERKLAVDELMALAQASVAVAQECACGIAHYREWTRTPATFPQEQMGAVGTLAGDPYDEPTYAEYHPTGSNYWSPDAPIALRHFPYNRCAVQQCTVCGRCCLHYVEAGGYYVEPRVRALDPRYVVDQPTS